MSSIIVKFQLYSTAEIYLCFVNCVCSWAISRSYTRHSFHLPPPSISPVPLSATFFSVVLFSHSYVFVLFGDLMNLNRPSCVTTCLELSMEPGDLSGGFITKDNDFLHRDLLMGSIWTVTGRALWSSAATVRGVTLLT